MSGILGDTKHDKIETLTEKLIQQWNGFSFFNCADCDYINLVAAGHTRLRFAGFRTTSSTGGLPVRRVRRGCRVPC